MDILALIFQFAILFLSIMIHEISHGSAALALGDTTAKDEGRLTFNPVKHFDLWGTFLLPLLMLFATQGRAFFGWAKPVPFNPYNLKNPKRDAGLIGLAGPLSNLVVALFFGGIIRILVHFNYSGSLVLVFDLILQINLMLAVFNLLPIPPMDGSRILYAFLPRRFEGFMLSLERYGFFLLLIVILFGAPYLGAIIGFLRDLLIGL